MVQEENRRRFTDDDIVAYINRNQAQINTLSRKFYYFTYLNKADLVQEGKLKIIEILRDFENGKIAVNVTDLNKYLGRSLINHYISLVRKFPADEFFNPDWFAYSHGTTSEDIDDMLLYAILDDDILTELEYTIVIYLLCGYPKKEIAKRVHLNPRAVSYRLACIKKKLVNLI